jgi:hypothetical protein
VYVPLDAGKYCKIIHLALFTMTDNATAAAVCHPQIIPHQLTPGPW